MKRRKRWAEFWRSSATLSCPMTLPATPGWEDVLAKLAAVARPGVR